MSAFYNHFEMDDLDAWADIWEERQEAAAEMYDPEEEAETEEEDFEDDWGREDFPDDGGILDDGDLYDPYGMDCYCNDFENGWSG